MGHLIWHDKDFFFFGHATQHEGVVVPGPGNKPMPLQWKCKMLTAGMPGKSWT